MEASHSYGKVTWKKFCPVAEIYENRYTDVSNIKQN